MMDGWEYSLGANMEHEYAMNNDIDIRYFRKGVI